MPQLTTTFSGRRFANTCAVEYDHQVTFCLRAVREKVVSSITRRLDFSRGDGWPAGGTYSVVRGEANRPQDGKCPRLPTLQQAASLVDPPAQSARHVKKRERQPDH